MKASIRLALNTSPEPFTNIAASIGEDFAVAGVILLATAHPWIALVVATILLVSGAALAGVPRQADPPRAGARYAAWWAGSQVQPPAQE